MALLVLAGAVIAADYGVFRGTILVEGEQVVGLLAPDAPLPPGDVAVIDLDGKIVLPGGIDPHCHFRARNEDFYNGTMGAAAGGISTVIEMPQGDPPVTDLDSLDMKLARAGAQAVVDYGLWGAAVPGNSEQIGPLFERGVAAVKAFMALSSATITPSLAPVDNAELYQAMLATAAAGGVLGVHAEDNALVLGMERLLQTQGRRDVAAHMEARSPLAEYVAIEQALTLAMASHVQLHIVHLTIARGAERIAAAKRAGCAVTVETCPSYLLMDSKDYERMGPYAKCLPPLRSRADVDGLWDFIRTGGIDFIASDHAPYPAAQVRAGEEDIWLAPNGVVCNQVMMPLLLDEAIYRRGLTLDAFARLSATNAARRFGLYPRKGTIAPGSDADFAIYDLNSPWQVDQARLFSREKRTPYHGRSCRVRLERTLVRGSTVYERGQICVAPGYGRFISRSSESVPRIPANQSGMS